MALPISAVTVLKCVDAVCCQRSTEEREYWFGLFKIVAPPDSGSYWFATAWYGSFKSTYRWWARGYPRHRYATCVRITRFGWKDRSCDYDYYFTCKKDAGHSVFLS